MQQEFKIANKDGKIVRVKAKNSKLAAMKAAVLFMRDKNKNNVDVTDKNKNNVDVTVQNSNVPVSYNIKRVPLSQPMKIKLPDGKEIEYTTRNEITKETRFFTLISYGSTKTKQGRYTGQFPKSACSKAFTRLCRSGLVKNNKKIIITIRETTRGSDKKTHSYECIRQKLSNPQNIQIGGASITYQHKNIITKINQ